MWLLHVMLSPTAALRAGEGAKVVVLDRPADDGPASRVARSVDGTPLLVDITDADAPDALLDVARARHCGQKEQQVCWSHFASLSPIRVEPVALAARVMTNVGSKQFRSP